MDIGEFSQKKQIRNLLLLIFCAIGFAFVLTGGALYLYGPSGQYLLGNALIAPSILPDLAYDDSNSKTGGSSRFVFDSIEFSYYDTGSKQEKRITVGLDQYAALYALLKNDMSVLEPDTHIYMATLSIIVRTESYAKWQEETKPFESVSFARDGDHYKVHLHEEKNPDQWVYFYHPGIYRKILNTLSILS